MNQEIIKRLDLSKVKLSIIYLGTQSLANIFFGLSTTLIIVRFLNLSYETISSLFRVYVLIYLAIFVPFFALLPHRLLKFTLQVVDRLKKGERVAEKEVSRAISQLVNYHTRSSLTIACADFLGFVLGISILRLGIIPALMPIINTISIAGLALGTMTALIHGYLNDKLCEIYLHPLTENLVRLYPHILQKEIKIVKTSLFSKVLLLVALTIIAIQTSLLTTFLSKIAVSYPNEFRQSLFFTAVLNTLTLFYTILIASMFSQNFNNSLKKLISWSRKISRGDLSARIHTVTDNEFTKLFSTANQMAQELEDDRNLISAEKNKLSLVLSGITDGVLALNRHHKIVFLNPAAEKIIGCSLHQAVGKQADEVFHLLDKNNNPLPAKTYCPAKSRNHKNQTLYSQSQVKLLTSEQKERYLSLMSANIQENKPTNVAYIVTFRDITEQRELERMKLDFVAMAAHELRTPITSIMGYLSVLRDEIGPSLSPEYQEFINRSLISGKKLTALMENLLSITRIEKGETNIAVQPLNWPKLVAEKIKEFKHQAEEKKLKLIWQTPKKAFPKVLADPLRITEVLNNLLNNAITYTHRGQVKIWCDYDQNKNSVTTHIKDTGPGIPAENLPHLFEKFYRITGPLEEGSKGTGLGLYISKSIIKLHGGKIWVESEPGKGSTFSFSLPCVHRQFRHHR